MSLGSSRIKVRGPAGLLAVVPYLLGYAPQNSLVIVAVTGPHATVRCALRYDLPDPPGTSEAARIAEHAAGTLLSYRCTTAIVAGYGSGTSVTPIADVIRQVLPRSGVRLHDVLRVDEDRRFWSYLCTDTSCCPAGGCPVPGLDHPISRTLAGAGLTVAPSREAVVASIASHPDPQAVAHATRQAQLAARDQLASHGEADARAAARQLTQDAITLYRDGQDITDLGHLARLAVALTDAEVRDDAWAQMQPDHIAAHIRLWTDVTRHAAPGLTAAPASLLAFIGWQADNGCLAHAALDRAEADHPAFPMARALRPGIDQGLPPAAAEAIRPAREPRGQHRRRPL